MLKPAQLYTEQIRTAFWNTAYDDKYKFYHVGYHEEYKPSNSQWCGHEYASVDKDDNLLGYIKYTIYQRVNSIDDLAIINFSNNKIEFGKDVHIALDNALTKYGFRKLNWNVICGNPIEDTYDKLCLKYGGRIIGVMKNEVKLSDGKFYDKKLYEIFAENYMNNRAKYFKNEVK